MKAMCSDKLNSSRKNTAIAAPISKYCTGCTACPFNTSSSTMPAKVRTMKRMPYFVARSDSDAGLTGSMKSTPKDCRHPFVDERVCAQPAALLPSCERA